MDDIQFPRTHLFIVRVWLENLGQSRMEFRGKVQHVPGRKVRYFRGWSMLITILQEMIAEPEEPNDNRSLP